MSIETVIVACRSFECKWPCSASGSLSNEAFACSEILEDVKAMTAMIYYDLV